MFVGDRATYTIELTCAPGVEVLADDLSRDKLELEGLEAIESESQRQSGADGGSIFRSRYVLTTYRADGTSLRIAPITVRYGMRRAGQRVEEAAPAGEIQAHVDLPASTLSHHLKRLVDAGVMQTRGEGTFHYYSADYSALRKLTDYLWEDCCKRGKSCC